MFSRMCPDNLKALHLPSSHDVRDYVTDYLHNEHFCCGTGRWGRSIADGFMIGGHWSGTLSRHTWARELVTEIEHIKDTCGSHLWGRGYSEEYRKPLEAAFRVRLNTMWDKGAPKAYKGIPYERDPYKTSGYADDAMVITQELYDVFLKTYENRGDEWEHIDVEYEDVSPAMIGTKWLVVVDYHS